MRTAVTIVAAAVALLALACSESKPVAEEQVADVRVVPQTVEIEVPVFVTRVVSQTVEVEVPVVVPQIGNPESEVSSNPVLPAITLEPAIVPDVSLKTTNEAPLWVHMFRGEDGDLKISTQPDSDRYGWGYLDVLVTGGNFIMGYRMFGGGSGFSSSSGSGSPHHAAVDGVIAQTETGSFKCERNARSDSERSIFACNWLE